MSHEPKGTAYVFTRVGGGWSYQATLTAVDGVRGDYFGAGVAVAGDRIIVGASLDDVAGVPNAGSAFAFRRDGSAWRADRRLFVPGAAANDGWGWRAALCGQRALIARDGGVAVFERTAADWEFRETLTSPDPTYIQRFGGAVALGDDAVLVGAPDSESPTTWQIGAACYYRRVSGAFELDALLQLSADGDLSTGDDFGELVDVSGATVAVAAPGDRTAGQSWFGGVFIFSEGRHGWNVDARLAYPPGGHAESMALADDALVMGAPYDDHFSSDQGAVYISDHRNGVWGDWFALAADDGRSGDHFGDLVAVSGDTIAVVAAGRYRTSPDDPYPDYGTVYIFARQGDGWHQQAKLEPAEYFPLGWFGTSIAIDGDTLAVGRRWNRHDDWPRVSHVYVYRRHGETWSLETRLDLADSYVGFGDHTAVKGSRVAAAAPFDFLLPGGFPSGGAYSYVGDGGTWAQETRVAGDDALAGDEFAFSLALVDDTLIVGAPRTSLALPFSGAAYVFHRDGPRWNQHQRISPEATAGEGFGERLAASGNRLAVGTTSTPNAAGQRIGSARVYTLRCAPPVIQDGPRDVVACAGEAAAFEVFSNAVPPVYQWYHNGAPIAGGNAVRLTIAAVAPGDAGFYYVVVGDGCGTTVSSMRRLSVVAPCDVNCDGTTNTTDIQPFINLLAAGGAGCSSCAGDANADGSVNLFDAAAFVGCLGG